MIGFDPEDYYKAERMEMRRKRKAAGPLAWLQNLLAPITGSDGTISIPPSVLPDLAGDVTGPPGTNVVEAIQGIPVSTTDPTLDQVLAFDGAEYVPADPAAGSTLTIAEIDGAPTGTPTTLQLPNGTVTDLGGGIFRYTPAAVPAAPVDATYVVRTANGTLTNEVLLSAVLASELQTRYEPLTNGDWGAPDLIFFEGNVIMVEVAN